MLREIAGVRQDQAELRRRWFQDDYLDLFVWVDRSGQMTAFQLAYDRTGDEHLLEWEHSRGYLHRRVVDDRGTSRGIGGSPLLAIGQRFPKYRVMMQFDARSAMLEEGLRNPVRQRIAAYTPRRARRPFALRRGPHRAHRL
jgi:uncharacterized protein RhaS with RHS repeats